jgi:hypothetical protein
VRILFIALAALLAAAGTAAAQVAAPSLNPTPTLRWNDNPGLVDDSQNPAVLPWAGPSRVAATYGISEFEFPAFGKIADGDAKAVEVQFVGETLAAAVHAATLNMDLIDPFGPGTFDLSRQSVGIAGQFGGWLSVGAGVEKQTFENANPFKQTETLTMGGATLRLGEVFYLGAAGGTATIKEETAVPQDEVKASATRYGLAYHWRDKERGVHLEAYHTERGAKASPLGLSVTETNINGYSVEFIFARFMLSVVGHTDKQKDPSGTPTETLEQSTASLGFVPDQGFAVVAGLSTQKLKDPATGVEQAKVTVTEIGVAWLF